MLDPEYLEKAGDLVASVYAQIEAEMCDELVCAMLAGNLTSWQAQAALYNLSQGEAVKLRAILERHRKDIDAAVRKEVEDALRRSDAYDLAVLKQALGVDLPAVTTQQIAFVCKTVAEMLEHDNVAMLDGARDAFFRESTRAITETATGHISGEEAVRNAVRRLARDGIDAIQYRDPLTGNKTVRNKADVAVRRHVRSQLSQECATRTFELCDQAGCEYIEVSSHYGARPSHQQWEGRVYHVGGTVTVDGTTYEDFAEGTGYYGTGPHAALGDRLCGVNCRHHFGPWVPGTPRAYHPQPEHPSGRTNEEIYKLTQTQRRMERNIRDTKRELAAALRAYEQTPSPQTQTAANQLKARLTKQQDALKDLIKKNDDVLTREPRREWAGDMPRVRVPKDVTEVNEPRASKKLRKQRMTTEPVNLDYVRSEHFAAQFSSIEESKTRDTIIGSARGMLEHRSRTVYEDFYAIEVGSGEVVASKTNDKTPHAVLIPPRITSRLDAMRRDSVIVMHNHPQSMPPSVADYRMCLHKAVRNGVIVCHDGRAFAYGVVDSEKFIQAVKTRRGWENLDRTLSEMVNYFGDEAFDRAVVPTLEENYGITYSRLTAGAA